MFSNFGTLEGYIANLLEMLKTYEEAETGIGVPDMLAKVKSVRERIDLAFLVEDIPMLMAL